MSHGIGYALAAMICFGFADLVYKRAATAGVQAHHFMMVQGWCFAPAVTLYGLSTGTLAIGPPAWWGAAAGFCAFAGFYNFARSLKTGSVSVNAPIFRLSFTITAALAVWLLDEPLTPAKLAGLALALAAVWLLLGGNGGDRSARRASRSSLLQVLAATVAIGVANVLYKFGVRAEATAATLLVAQASMFVPLSTGFAAIVDRAIRPPLATWRYAGAAALLLAFGFVLLIESLAFGQASVMVPIAQMGFIVTAALGIIFLREPWSPRKGAGLAIALAALACLARG